MAASSFAYNQSLQALPDPVHWFEGMLLSPQHFQQNNIYFEQSLLHQMQRTNPFFWGLHELEIDLGALSSEHRILVNRVSAVMRDGTVVQHATKLNAEVAQEHELSLALDDIPDLPKQKPFYIHLALPKVSDACASDANASAKRYDSVNVGKSIDLNDMHNQIDFVRLRPRLSLLLSKDNSAVGYQDQEVSPNFSHFPILKLRQDVSGSFEILKYTPPVFYVPREQAPYNVTLGDDIQRLLGDIRSKAEELKNFFSNTKTQDARLSDVQRQRIQCLTSDLPPIEVMLNSYCHPYSLYIALTSMAGTLAVLHSSMMPPRFSAYQHNNLDATFEKVMSFIREVNDSIRLNFSCITFEQITQEEPQPDIFNARVEDFPKEHKLFIACRLASGSNREQLGDWIKTARIATDDCWDKVNKSRALGAKRELVSEFKTLNIAENEQEVLFEIDTQGSFMSPQQTLHIMGTENGLKAHQPSSISWFVPVNRSE